MALSMAVARRIVRKIPVPENLSTKFPCTKFPLTDCNKNGAAKWRGVGVRVPHWVASSTRLVPNHDLNGQNRVAEGKSKSSDLPSTQPFPAIPFSHSEPDPPTNQIVGTGFLGRIFKHFGGAELPASHFAKDDPIGHKVPLYSQGTLKLPRQQVIKNFPLGLVGLEATKKVHAFSTSSYPLPGYTGKLPGTGVGIGRQDDYGNWFFVDSKGIVFYCYPIGPDGPNKYRFFFYNETKAVQQLTTDRSKGWQYLEAVVNFHPNGISIPLSQHANDIPMLLSQHANDIPMLLSQHANDTPMLLTQHGLRLGSKKTFKEGSDSSSEGGREYVSLTNSNSAFIHHRLYGLPEGSTYPEFVLPEDLSQMQRSWFNINVSTTATALEIHYENVLFWERQFVKHGIFVSSDTISSLLGGPQKYFKNGAQLVYDRIITPLTPVLKPLVGQEVQGQELYDKVEKVLGVVPQIRFHKLKEEEGETVPRVREFSIVMDKEANFDSYTVDKEVAKAKLSLK